MDGIVRMRTIAFTPDRVPTLRRIRLGYEGDNLVERLEFDLPEIAAGQTATLMITGADVVKLDRTDEGRYAVDLTRDMIGPDGEREAYVRIDGAGGGVWQSAPMRMTTGALPDVEEEIERVYPTAVGQMLTAMAEHSGEMTAQEERVEQAAQRAEDAAKRAEAGGGSGSGGSAVEIDATLTQEGKAADAKATGDRLSELSKEIDDLKENGGGESGAGFTREAKTLLIQILRGGVYSDDMSVKISELTAALGLDMVNYILYQGTMSAVPSGVGFILEYSYTNRLSLLADLGELAIKWGSYEGYPICIPAGATGVELTAPSNFRFGYFFTAINGNKYEMLYDSGWQAGFTYPHIIDVPTDYSDGEHYMFINFSLPNNGDIPLDEYSDSISIKFVYE